MNKVERRYKKKKKNPEELRRRRLLFYVKRILGVGLPFLATCWICLHLWFANLQFIDRPTVDLLKNSKTVQREDAAGQALYRQPDNRFQHEAESIEKLKQKQWNRIGKHASSGASRLPTPPREFDNKRPLQDLQGPITRLYASYFGGRANDVVRAAAAAEGGGIWIAGHTESDMEPRRRGGAAAARRARIGRGSAQDAFAALIGAGCRRL
mmetsp:Transcript_490/g.1076  ORF Transcript_490/g.1076 Transcript_490/m.1076 type:complete len:210 (-) Transcript_490:228-857(-)